MKVSTRTQFALRILIQLGTETRKGHLLQGKEIAARQGINEPYLEQIMVSLKKAGVVQTVRGRNGGYLLARAPIDVPLLEVIETFEGELDLSDAKKDGKLAESPESVAATSVWAEMTRALRESAGKITLASIIDKEHQSLVYVI